MTAVADQVRPAPRVGQERPSAFKLTVILVVLLVIASFVPRAWSAWQNRSPYSASALDAHVTMSVVHAGQAQAAVDAVAGRGALAAPTARDPKQQYIVGQLSFRTPRDAPADGQYALFLIDARLKQPVQLFGTGRDGTNVAQGWDGSYDKIARRYPSLSALGTGGLVHGSAVSFPPNTRGPISFVAMLDPSALPITDIDTQVTVALAFESANHTLHWVARLGR